MSEHGYVLGTTHDTNMLSIPTAEGIRYEPAHYRESKPASEYSPLLDPRDKPPWVWLKSGPQGDYRVIRASDDATIASVTGRNEPERHSRAVFIVRAVNMHDELVSLLADIGRRKDLLNVDLASRLCVLLAKAKGES